MSEADMKLAIERSNILFRFYCAERRAGTPPLEAHLLMAEYAKRLDALAEQRAKETVDATS